MIKCLETAIVGLKNGPWVICSIKILLSFMEGKKRGTTLIKSKNAIFWKLGSSKRDFVGSLSNVQGSVSTFDLSQKGIYDIDIDPYLYR